MNAALLTRRAPAGCVVAVLGVALATALGVLLVLLGSRREPRAAGFAAPVPVTDVGTVPHGTAPKSPGSRPDARTLPAGSRLRLRGVDAVIRPVAAPGGVMRVPRDPRRLGWWTGSNAPGGDAGTTVVVGHVNYAGVRGALAGIAALRPGATVRIVEPHLRLAYRIAAVRTYPKTTGIPAGVFARTGRPRLVLITCGGPFDPSTGNYLDNIVAYAVPA